MEQVAFDFTDKIVVITGASGGIGEATARKFAESGATIFLHTNQNVQSVAKILKECGGCGECFQADFSCPSSRKDFLSQIFEKTNRIDVWVNGAGVDLMNPTISSLDFDKKLQYLFEVDVFATLELSRQVGQLMKKQGSGTIFFFGWSGVESGWEGPTGELYGAAKGAIQGFCRNFAESLAPEVRLRCLALGWIKTRWGKTSSDDFSRRVVCDSLVERWGEPKEIAETILFLSSENSSYIDAIPLKLNGVKRGTRH